MRSSQQTAADRLAEATNLALSGRLTEAENVYRSIAADHPYEPEAHFVLAQLLQRRGDQKKAYEAYKKAVVLAPAKILYWHRLGGCLTQLGEYDAAVIAFQRAIALRPDQASLYLNLAGAHYRQGEHEAAIAAVEQAIELHHDYDLAYLELGNQFQALGDFEKARKSFRRAMDLNPRLVEAYHQLARIGEWTGDTKVVLSKLNEISRLDELSADTRSSAHFTIAYIHEQHKKFDDAFESYSRANALVRQRYHFDRQGVVELVDALIESFRPELLNSQTNVGCQSQLPIFIIGMPRSGTTLIEQIISSHPLVSAGGEFTQMGRICRALMTIHSDSLQYPRDIGKMIKNDLSPLSDEYLNYIRRQHPAGKIRVTDKFLFNFLHLGLINILFPNAVIIHCKRNPMDTCLSCYFQRFAQTQSLAFSNDLSDVGFYYRQYERLMHHWRTILSTSILEVHYEDLVEHQEQKSREIIEFVGLKWDDACLKFHESKQAVRTASTWQVRQPIYRSSKARWRRYEKHLDPLKQALAAAS